MTTAKFVKVYNAGVKKMGVLLAMVLVISLFFLFSNNNKNQPKIFFPTLPLPSTSPSRDNLEINARETKSILVPYWGMNQSSIDSSSYDRLFYFGIAVNKEGIDKEEEGFRRIKTFINLSDRNKERFLVVRMIDSPTNSFILENKDVQQKIISESVDIAKEKGFDGLVLDFEIASLSFQSVIDKITRFYAQFSEETNKNDLFFYITLYGDVFYRLRPYDVKAIEKYTDNILIMAYDFHKARGNQGPNFPLNGENIYGYDFVRMIEDYEKVVPKEKLVIVFGMFGYDWIVDDSGQAIEQAESLSFNQAKERFLLGCKFSLCLISRDQVSAETKVTYVGSDGKKHEVWFEDMKSVSAKQNFLKSKGINSFAFWAYSYF